MNFRAKDFALGWEIGEEAEELGKKNRLREGLKKLDEQQVETVTTPQAADPNTEQSKMLAAQNEGLTNELPPTPTVSGYKYGDQTFQYKPPAEYVDALKAKQRAALFEQYGDIDKAQSYREAAAKQLAGSYKTIAETAFAKGTPEAIVNAYSLINDGFDAKLEKNKDGTLRVLLYPEGQPDQTEEIFSGDSASVVDWAMKNTNPELYLKFADAATMRDYRKSLLEDRQLAREDRGLVAQDRARQQNEANILRQIQILDRRAQQALATEQEDVFISASQQRDALEARLSGLTGAGGLASGASQTGAVPPRAIFDYLVREKGVDPVKAVGVVASAEQESGFDPTAVHDNNTGYGLFGHRLDRRDKLFAHANSQAPSWTQQIDYLLTEPEVQEYLRGNYGSDYGLAAKQFTSLVERPANVAQRAVERARLAQNYAPYLSSESQQGLTATPAAPASSGIDYKKMYASGRQAATALRPATNLSPAQRDKIIQEVEDEVMLDPDFLELSPDAQQQALQTRIATRLAQAASATGAAPADTVSTPEQRAARAAAVFRQMFGLPDPQAN